MLRIVEYPKLRVYISSCCNQMCLDSPKRFWDGFSWQHRPCVCVRSGGYTCSLRYDAFHTQFSRLVAFIVTQRTIQPAYSLSLFYCTIIQFPPRSNPLALESTLRSLSPITMCVTAGFLDSDTATMFNWSSFIASRNFIIQTIFFQTKVCIITLWSTVIRV